MANAISADRAPAKADVTISYQGESAPLSYHEHQQVHALLEQALDAFGITERRGDYALFEAAGRELPAHASLREAGVHAGDHLVLRSTVVYVVYNGITRPVAYRADEQVGEVLRQALQLFNITSNGHLMALFDAANVELSDGQTLEQAGVEPGARLVLRQSAVRGG